MTQAILLQSLTEIVTIGLLFYPTPIESGVVPPSPPPRQEVLAVQVKYEPKYYEVKSTDTLASIAQEVYGSEAHWTILWNDNDWLSVPTMIHSGDKLRLRDSKPDKQEEITRPLPTPTTTPTPTITPTPTRQPETQASSSTGNFSQVYVDAGNKYGIPWQILYAIHIIETGGRDGAITSGYGTGAQGPMQFMQGTWVAYGVDGNGDGNADINNAADAIHAAANYLQKHGDLEAGLRSYGIPVQRVFDLAGQHGYTR